MRCTKAGLVLVGRGEETAEVECTKSEGHYDAHGATVAIEWSEAYDYVIVTEVEAEA